MFVFILWMLLGLGLLSAAVSVVASLAGMWHRFRPRRSSPTNCPPISVLKPIKGADENLYGNLCAMAEQDYPEFEILVGIEDGSDAAVGIARKVQERYGKARIRVILGAPAIGMNPKVNNLHHLLQFTDREWVLVSDADTLPERDYLSDAMAFAQGEGAALVHHRITGVGAKSMAACLEAHHLGGWVGPAIVAAETAGHPCVIGKSMLMRREVLEEIGGFRAFRNVLAEDYLIGKAMHDAGYAVRLAPLPLAVQLGHRSLSQVGNRTIRWAQMQRTIHPSAFLSEWLLCSIPWMIPAFWAGLQLHAYPALNLLLILNLMRTLEDSLVAARNDRYGGALGPLWTPVRDLFALITWWVACTTNVINWKGKKMRIAKGSELQPVHTTKKVLEAA